VAAELGPEADADWERECLRALSGVEVAGWEGCERGDGPVERLDGRRPRPVDTSRWLGRPSSARDDGGVLVLAAALSLNFGAAELADPDEEPELVREPESSSRRRRVLRSSGDCATGVRTVTEEDPDVRRFAEGVWKPRLGCLGLRGVSGMKGRSARSVHRSGDAGRGCSMLLTRLCEGEGKTDWVTSCGARAALVSPSPLLTDDAEVERELGRLGRLYASGMVVEPSGRR